MTQRTQQWRSARSNGAAHAAMLAQHTAIAQRAAINGAAQWRRYMPKVKHFITEIRD
jgi:hypothetical protein